MPSNDTAYQLENDADVLVEKYEDETEVEFSTEQEQEVQRRITIALEGMVSEQDVSRRIDAAVSEMVIEEFWCYRGCAHDGSVFEQELMKKIEAVYEKERQAGMWAVEPK